MDVIARIKRKLAYLQAHNDDDSMIKDLRLGQRMSRYAVYTRHTEEEISQFEAEHQIRLPEDYRQFIMEIGSEGYSPGTLYSPLVSMLTGEAKKDFYQRLLNQSIQEDEAWKEYAPSFGNLKHPFPSRLSLFNTVDLDSDKPAERFVGHLPIIFDGCQCWYVLITAGKAYGQIWYGDGPIHTPVMIHKGELFHAKRALLKMMFAQRVNFTQWYEAWLNKQIRIAQDHWRKRGRNVPPLTLDDH